MAVLPGLAIADRADAAVKILGRGFGAHAAVDEADQVREIMIAEKSGHLPLARV